MRRFLELDLLLQHCASIFWMSLLLFVAFRYWRIRILVKGMLGESKIDSNELGRHILGSTTLLSIWFFGTIVVTISIHVYTAAFAGGQPA